MARPRGPRLVVTFPTTHAALAFEAACREEGVAGRIVPVPVSVTADCGLAWAVEPQDLGSVARLARARGLAYAKVYDVAAGVARERPLEGE